MLRFSHALLERVGQSTWTQVLEASTTDRLRTFPPYNVQGLAVKFYGHYMTVSVSDDFVLEAGPEDIVTAIHCETICVVHTSDFHCFTVADTYKSPLEQTRHDILHNNWIIRDKGTLDIHAPVDFRNLHTHKGESSVLLEQVSKDLGLLLHFEDLFH